MTKPPAILHPESQKASYLAHGVLCALGTAVVAAVATMIWHGAGKVPPPVVAAGGGGAAGPLPVSPPPYSSSVMPADVALLPAAPPPPPASLAAPTAPPSSFSGLQQPPAPTPAALANQPPQPVMNSLPPTSGVPMSIPGVPAGPSSALPDTPRPALPPGRELKDPRAIESVMAAREVRKTQDMQAALNELRTADLREPNHPEILGEMALTYELMGIESKAQSYWRQIVALGEGVAGGYYALAKSKLEGAPGGPGGSPPAASPVNLGNCQVIQDPTVQKGERITVRVPIIATRGATINPAEMTIHVLLYESVNNGAYIEQVRGSEPRENWVSQPVNWQDTPEETLDLVYDLPAPPPEQVRDLGRRKFHGYVVKLFYQDRLVGEQIHPESLRSVTQKGGPAGADDSLFRR